MKINEKKTKCMVFNYTNKYQFNPKLNIKGEQIDVIDSTPLLGTIITSDLSWEQNTSHLVKKSNARMELLRRVASFGANIHDLKTHIICKKSTWAVCCSVAQLPHRAAKEWLGACPKVSFENYPWFQVSKLQKSIRYFESRAIRTKKEISMSKICPEMY